MAAPNDPIDPPAVPEVMFLPLAITAGDGWPDLDKGMFARRIPDFVHQVLNEGHPGPTALLELQTTTDGGPVTWVQFTELPDHDDAFDLIPAELDVRAIVGGTLAPAEGGLRVEFVVYRDEDDEDEAIRTTLAANVSLDDPVAGLLRLARQLARVLELRFHEPPRGLLTNNGAAFRLFLQGLDNAMLLSGDLDIAVPDDREELMRPFADALALDPSFGLALRVANATTSLALDGRRLDQEAVRRFLDRCYSTQPADGDACVAIAEQLSGMGDDQRAIDWLQHATLLDPPPPRGLEHLGILMARRGDVGAARGLWQKGLDIDGHPDFFSHLAQLCFVEGRDEEAWELVQRGLRRLRERTLRAGEWDDPDGGAGVLLECLLSAMDSRTPPAVVGEALAGLRSLLRGEHRVFLGACLANCGKVREARHELTTALRAPDLPLDLRDRAVRNLLKLDMPRFEARFAAAVDEAQRAARPHACFQAFQAMLDLQAEFWPALFFSAVAKRRLGEADEALDLLAAARDLSPGQPDVLFQMAELFAARGNGKRALELVDEAIAERSGDADMHAAKVRYLRALGRADEARQALQTAFRQGLDTPELRKLGRALRR